MADEVSREPARDPQDLERLLVSRERAEDVDGMAALYEPHAVLDCGGGRLTLGREAIRALYAGRKPTLSVDLFPRCFGNRCGNRAWIF